MILTVTPNVALDRTYVIDHLEVGAVHKVSETFAHTGGKGVNVSRTVAALGGKTLVSGLIGAKAAEAAREDLIAAGLNSSLYPVGGAPRQTVTVTAKDGTTTAFDESGPTVTEREWEGFEAHIAGLLNDVRLVVIAGSLPPGAPEQAFEHLCAAANHHGVPVVVDARGAAMRAAQNQTPLVAKLNRRELAETLDRDLRDEQAIVEGALDLRCAGAQHVIVTLGAEGAIGVDRDEVWRVTHPPAQGNPIGAGDAFSAGLALALVDQKPFAEALLDGAAAAVGSLRAPTAGALDPSDMRAAASTVRVERIAAVSAR